MTVANLFGGAGAVVGPSLWTPSTTNNIAYLQNVFVTDICSNNLGGHLALQNFSASGCKIVATRNFLDEAGLPKFFIETPFNSPGIPSGGSTNSELRRIVNFGSNLIAFGTASTSIGLNPPVWNCLVSNDHGQTWTTNLDAVLQNGQLYNPIVEICNDDDRIYVIVPGAGIHSSTTGLPGSWILRLAGSFSKIIRCDRGILTLVTGGTGIHHSLDGITWSSLVTISLPGDSIRNITYGAGTYVIVTTLGKIYTTSDILINPASWTERLNTSTAFGGLVGGLYYGGSQFLAQVEDNTSPYGKITLASYDSGVTWQQETNGLFQNELNGNSRFRSLAGDIFALTVFGDTGGDFGVTYKSFTPITDLGIQIRTNSNYGSSSNFSMNEGSTVNLFAVHAYSDGSVFPVTEAINWSESSGDLSLSAQTGNQITVTAGLVASTVSGQTVNLTSTPGNDSIDITILNVAPPPGPDFAPFLTGSSYPWITVNGFQTGAHPAANVTAIVGDILAINWGSGQIDDGQPDGTATYIWYRNGSPTGITTFDYVVTGADVGTTITARVTVTNYLGSASTLAENSASIS